MKSTNGKHKRGFLRSCNRSSLRTDLEHSRSIGKEITMTVKDCPDVRVPSCAAFKRRNFVVPKSLLRDDDFSEISFHLFFATWRHCERSLSSQISVIKRAPVSLRTRYDTCAETYLPAGPFPRCNHPSRASADHARGWRDCS